MNKIFYIVVSLSLLVCTGCGASYYLPFEEELTRIENLPYEKEVMDCKHKAVMYHDYLKENGVVSRVVSGKVEGYRTSHAWVEVYKDKWYMVDPTWKSPLWETGGWVVNPDGDGFEVDQYPERVVLCTYNPGVRVEDIKNGSCEGEVFDVAGYFGDKHRRRKEFTAVFAQELLP